MGVTLPKIETQEDRLSQDVERLKEGDNRVLLLAMLRAMTGGGPNLPMSDDYAKVARDARESFKRNDFSDAFDVVNTLELLVEFYKDWAETYMQSLASLGASFNESGDVETDPFIVLDKGGRQVLGSVEVIELTDYTDEDMEMLWVHYISKYLSVASDREREWIVANFADKVSELGVEE